MLPNVELPKYHLIPIDCEGQSKPLPSSPQISVINYGGRESSGGGGSGGNLPELDPPITHNLVC